MTRVRRKRRAQAVMIMVTMEEVIEEPVKEQAAMVGMEVEMI